MGRGLLLGLGVAGCLLYPSGAGARTPQAFECESHVAQRLARSVVRCRGKDFGGVVCPRRAVDGARGGAEEVPEHQSAR
jgi:hypothetical protein